VILDVRAGELRLEPVAPGEPLGLEATYDPGTFELEEHYDSGGDSGWEYRVVFRHSRFWRWDALRAALGGRSPLLRLRLPRGVPLVLEGRILTVESALELGGLWVTSTDLEVGRGYNHFRFGEPLPAPMERFVVRGVNGALRISSLGNASPRVAEVGQSRGRMTLDLHGAWTCDADVRASCRIGACTLLVSENVRVESAQGLNLPGPPAEVELPTVRLSVESSLARLRIERNGAR